MPMEKSFDAAAREPEIFAKWKDAGCFTAGANAKPGASAFSILLPPPNVTGFLHAGHGFNHTLMDILTRWHRMRGDDTLWQPGLDHAGIATQLVVERQLAEQGIKRTDLSREDFIAKVWDWKATSGGQIVEQDKRLGCSMDWSREAFTMQGAPGDPSPEDGPNFHDAVIRVFVDMFDKGYIYRGKRLVNWDPHFETAISDLEVENREVPGHMWHFKYPLAGGATYTYVEKDADGNVLFEEVRDYISIATTRPETMLGDGAVAVHPDDPRYAPIVGKLCEIPVGPKEHRRLIPIITDEYPDPDFGSGAVKITGAHDFNDYEVAKRGDIPMYRLMDTKGHMRDDGVDYAEAAEIAMAVAKGDRTLGETEADALNLVPDDLRGLDRFEARNRVVAQITEEGLAVMVPPTDPRLGEPAKPLAPEEGGEGRLEQLTPLVESKPIMQPFGDRSKVVIEPMLTDQWFVDTAQIVGPALEAVRSGEVKIIPESGEKTYFHWLENIEPWCISRQLWWGHQIPVWYGFDLHANGFTDDEGDGALDEVELGRILSSDSLANGDLRPHCAPDFTAVKDTFGDMLADLPTPLNHASVVEVATRDEALHRLSESLAEYVTSQDPTHLVYPVWRDPDVLDTWFSSGLWPIGTLGWGDDDQSFMDRYFPTSVLITGSDILFFWVARMMMMQYAVVGQRPFDTVYLHGLVRDAKGQKMSKSIGNVVDPLDLVDKYGADAYRFNNAAMASMTGTIRLDEKRIEGYRNFTTKLWNAFRFAEMNDALQHRAAAPPKPRATVNAWIMGETARTRDEVDAALEAFKFNDAADAIYKFVWNVVCDWYLEFSKPLFGSEDADLIAETQATMAWVLDQCLLLLHPMMPFVTEELWAGPDLLAVTDWPDYATADVTDADASAEIAWVISLIEAIRSVRGEVNVPAALKVELLEIELDAAGRTAWDRNAAMIQRLARVERLTRADAPPKGALTISVRGGQFALPLAGIVDVEAEKARLAKTLGKLEKDLGGLNGRLKNPKFLASAPDDVVDETKALVAEKSEEKQRLETAQARLAEL
ncbi:valine--tRNA ligase [Maribius pontilimi]|uniref:Valine--tRNA ligase n=1 Tax=Palleronia pontilimi TaxID=1964209 RepID=A0A934IH70_9RHOB|nr:valine--tRNA ligase [Palleronia pontilimi]MBJ3761804.1 valine--tRNA ligase [Palleronia pontilimi]